MSLQLEDVQKLAHLARIDLDAPSEGKAQAYLDQLQNILVLIEEMQAVDTTGIEPMAHAQDTTLRLREDMVTELDQHELFQSVAPQVEAGLYLVPKVIE